MDYPRTFSSVNNTIAEDCSLALLLDEGGALLTGITENVIRLRLTQHESLVDDHSYAIEGELPSSCLHVEENASTIIATTKNTTLSIAKDAFAVSLLAKDGTVLSEGCPFTYTPKRITDTRVANEHDEFYGLGERITPLSRRGYRIRNWNTDDWRQHGESTAEMYSSFPFMIAIDTASGRCFGYFLDVPYETTFSLGVPSWETLTIEATKGPFSAYFITGDTVADVLREYTALTGRHALPPLWALGYHQCRWSYMNTDEVDEIATTLREKKIPSDVIWYDIDYMDTFRVFTFDNERFGTIEAQCERLQRQGFQRVAIVDPGVKVDEKGVYDVYDEGVEKGYFIEDLSGANYVGKVWPGGTSFPDFSRKDVREWWGRLHKRYYDKGITAFWNDMNEPSDMATKEKTVPLHLRMYDEGRWSPMEKMHNVYATLEAKATVEDAMRRFRPNDRPFLLTRAGYAGIQKYSAKWGGDNVSAWAHLRESIAQTINMGLSGLGFFGADIGGFGGNATPELLARWTQVGAFYPFCRNHAAKGTPYQEPWRFGKEVEDVCRNAISLRYRLLPYIYQLFYEMHTTGAPMMRPLFWHYPKERVTYTLADEFLFGKYLLVAPVVSYGARSRMVYLPKGTWYHYETGDAYEGGKEHVVAAPLASIPVFVRAGSVLPVADVAMSTAFMDHTTLTLLVYPGGETRERFYEDDMRTNAYEEGAYLFHDITLSKDACSVRLAEGTRFTKVVMRVFKNKDFIEHVFTNEREISFPL